VPNHVHLILEPRDEDGLRRVMAGTHRVYSGLIQERRPRAGRFWRGRYAAVAMDEDHLRAAYRYVALNPVRAGLGEDPLTDLAPALERFAHFGDLLAREEDRDAISRLRKGESVGRPIGSDAFLASLEAHTGRRLHVLPRWLKPREGESPEPAPGGEMAMAPLSGS
jgi:putative transposase